LAEQVAVSQCSSPQSHSNELTTPLLFLSSEEIGWDGLVALAYHEPRQFEGLIESKDERGYISLVFFAGGAMYMEYRPVNGSWKGGIMRAEHLNLRPHGSEPVELRWNGLTTEPTQTLHLHLSKELLARTAEEVADSDPARLTLVGRSGFQDSLLAQIGLALWRELEQPTPTGKLYAQTAAQLLAVHLLRHYTCLPLSIKERSQGLTRQQVQRVMDFIQAHLSQDISLEALAQQIGFSSYHFAHVFRQTVGESPHQFVLRQRVERARHLLNATDTPLSQIALESGFANQSHLTRTFKRYLGLTPRSYRQNE